jgi:L-ascorbate metabolism protein UlaG (beta-lactamase superfamily)
MKMKRILLIVAFVSCCLPAMHIAGQSHITGLFKTSKGDLKISLPGHATVFFEFDGKTIWVDPISPYVLVPDNPPKADAILITHEHGDHLDLEGIGTVRTPKTGIIYAAECAEKLPGGKIMANGDKSTILDIPIEAVPAYNAVGMRGPGVPFHPKGVGNGYILTFGGLRVYVAGDTENVPEVKALNNINVAILPLLEPYTMSEEMLADAAKAIRPKVLFVYHTRTEDFSKLKSLLKGVGIDLRVR